jgi:ribosomal subunit interface protein
MIHITITTKNITLDNPLQVFIEDKIGGLEHLLGGGAMEVHVEIGKPSRHHHKGPVFYAEANVSIGGKILRAEAQHEDLRSAIVQVKEELQSQIKKFKEKRTDNARQPRA